MLLVALLIATPPTCKTIIISPDEMWHTDIFLPAIFVFLKIVGNARTFLRTYNFGTGTKNEKKFIRFEINMLITAMNGKEICLYDFRNACSSDSQTQHDFLVHYTRLLSWEGRKLPYSPGHCLNKIMGFQSHLRWAQFQPLNIAFM